MCIRDSNDKIEIANNNYHVSKNQEVSVSIKSESIQIKKNVKSKTNEKNSIVGKVTEITFLGQFVRYLVLLSNDQEIQVRSSEGVDNIKLNDQVILNWKLDDFILHNE